MKPANEATNSRHRTRETYIDHFLWKILVDVLLFNLISDIITTFSTIINNYFVNFHPELTFCFGQLNLTNHVNMEMTMFQMESKDYLKIYYGIHLSR